MTTPNPITTAEADRDDAENLLDDDRLTAMGLFIEVYTGVTERVERGIESHGLGMSDFEVMIRLARSPEHRLRMSELATQSTITNSGLTRVVDRLSRSGHVERVPCDTDRRGSFAQLTDVGLAVLAEVLPGHLDTVGRSFTEVLGTDRLESFLQGLRILRAEVRPGSDPIVAAAINAD
jgi:MarR family 2-MHQ and catechol resistance regulon transcriptional repressor